MQREPENVDFEVAALAALFALAFWLWNRFRARPLDSNIQQPGERWKFLDLRQTATGDLRLIRSDIDASWGVQFVPTDGVHKSTTTWYATEMEAREAFSAEAGTDALPL